MPLATSFFRIAGIYLTTGLLFSSCKKKQPTLDGTNSHVPPYLVIDDLHNDVR